MVPVLGYELKAELVEVIHTFGGLGYGLSRIEVMKLAKEIDEKSNSNAFGDNMPSDM